MNEVFPCRTWRRKHSSSEWKPCYSPLLANWTCAVTLERTLEKIITIIISTCFLPSPFSAFISSYNPPLYCIFFMDIPPTHTHPVTNRHTYKDCSPQPLMQTWLQPFAASNQQRVWRHRRRWLPLQLQRKKVNDRFFSPLWPLLWSCVMPFPSTPLRPSENYLVTNLKAPLVLLQPLQMPNLFFFFPSGSGEHVLFLRLPAAGAQTEARLTTKPSRSSTCTRKRTGRNAKALFFYFSINAYAGQGCSVYVISCIFRFIFFFFFLI